MHIYKHIRSLVRRTTRKIALTIRRVKPVNEEPVNEEFVNAEPVNEEPVEEFKPFLSLPTEIRFTIYELAILNEINSRPVMHYDSSRRPIQDRDAWKCYTHLNTTSLHLYLTTGIHPNMRNRLDHTIFPSELIIIAQSLLSVSRQVKNETLRILTTQFTLHFTSLTADPIFHEEAFGHVPCNHTARRFMHLAFDRPSIYWLEPLVTPKSLTESFPAVHSITVLHEEIIVQRDFDAMIWDASNLSPAFVTWDCRGVLNPLVPKVLQRMRQVERLRDASQGCSPTRPPIGS